uniref:Uncharacterized protein n=1 Tax=Ciona intestinalis TaxID=7719 RepID=H2Y0Y2_CIOIN
MPRYNEHKLYKMSMESVCCNIIHYDVIYYVYYKHKQVLLIKYLQ